MYFYNGKSDVTVGPLWKKLRVKLCVHKYEQVYGKNLIDGPIQLGVFNKT